MNKLTITLCLSLALPVFAQVNNPTSASAIGAVPLAGGVNMTGATGGNPIAGGINMTQCLVNGAACGASAPGLTPLNYTPNGHSLGDSIFSGFGVLSGTPSLWASHQILNGMGIPSANITDLAEAGTGITDISNQEFQSAFSSVVNNLVTVFDCCENNSSYGGESYWQSMRQEALALMVDAAVVAPANDLSGFPSKIYAVNSTVSGSGCSAVASTHYPTQGLTANGTSCTYTFNNVPGQDIYAIIEADSVAVNPSISVDGVSYTGHWSTGSWIVSITDPLDSATWAPWPLHITLPSTSNSTSILGPYKHTVAVTLPSGSTMIEVVGSGGDRNNQGPYVLVTGQARWWDQSIGGMRTVNWNNAALQSAAIEANRSGLNVAFADPSSYVDGALTPSIIWTGCTVNPQVTVSSTGGTFNIVSIVSGGTCSGGMTATAIGSGSGATLTPTLTGSSLTGLTSSGGSGYQGPQQFDTLYNHPTQAGATGFAQATLEKARALLQPRQMDAGLGAGGTWQEHNLISGMSAWITPTVPTTSIVLTGNTTAVIDPGRPGQQTRLSVCQTGGNAFTFTFPSNIYMNGTASAVITMPAGQCMGFQLSYSTVGTNPNSWLAGQTDTTSLIFPSNTGTFIVFNGNAICYDGTEVAISNSSTTCNTNGNLKGSTLVAATSLTSLGRVVFTPSTAVTSNTTLGSGVSVQPCNANSGNVVTTLPTSPALGSNITYYKNDSSANTCTLTVSGGNINSSSTFPLTTQWNSVTVQAISATQWIIQATH